MVLDCLAAVVADVFSFCTCRLFVKNHEYLSFTKKTYLGLRHRCVSSPFFVTEPDDIVVAVVVVVE